ncbi:MAG: (Na+)-NQR maturation NqrM [Gammaproteobacteria bacterium]
MTIFLLTLVIVSLAVLGMAAGVLLGRPPIAGSCGGMEQLGIACGVCEKPCAKKRHALEQARKQARDQEKGEWSC